MSNYEVRVIVNGRSIKLYSHEGQLWAEGRKGSEFELEFVNKTNTRVEIVPSVDGLSVMDGNPCGVDSDGYLVEAHSSIRIPGWRLNNNNVAAFVFKDKENSYISQIGGDVKKSAGVIGFMVFEEKVVQKPKPEEHHHHHHHHPWYPRPYPVPYPVRPREPADPWDPWGRRIIFSSDKTTGASTQSWDAASEPNDSGDMLFGASFDANTSASSGSSTRSAAEVKAIATEVNDQLFNLGVGWGDKIDHQIEVVDFQRKNKTDPTALIAVYYDDLKGLQNRGIVTTAKTDELPDPFPTYTSGCKPPPGWKG